MVRMKVFGLALDKNSQSPILVLKNDDESMALPIWIGAVEAMSISMALNNIPFPRPMTHDLLLSSVAELGGLLLQVDVTSIKDGTFFAELVVVQGERRMRIDCRPSDAIALAVRAECPIFVNPEVLESAGVNEDGLDHTVVSSKDADKWKDLLESLDEDETKYKM